MADTEGREAFGAYFFAVEIDGIQEAFFRSCSGLKHEADVFSLVEGGLDGHERKLDRPERRPEHRAEAGLRRTGVLEDAPGLRLEHRQAEARALQRHHHPVRPGPQASPLAVRARLGVEVGGAGVRRIEEQNLQLTVGIAHEGLRAPRRAEGNRHGSHARHSPAGCLHSRRCLGLRAPGGRGAEPPRWPRSGRRVTGANSPTACLAGCRGPLTSTTPRAETIRGAAR